MAARTLPGLTFPHSSLLTPLASLRPVIPGVSAEPKLRHSAHSRGIHASHHARIDAATTRSMTACVGQRCPPTSPTPFPRHSVPLSPVIPGLTRNLPSSDCPYLAGVDVSSLLTPLASLRPVIPGVSAEPKLRHSAHSRGIHASHHARIDAATTRSMTACAGQRCPHITHTIPPSFRAPITRHSGLDPESAQQWLPVPCRG